MEEVAYTLLAAATVAASLYLLHVLLAPRPRHSGAKEAPYACGEDVPPERVPFTPSLYKYICLFTVTDVVAMLLAYAFTQPSMIGAGLRYGVLAYCLTLVFVLITAVGWGFESRS